jgi:hypothetical protein
VIGDSREAALSSCLNQFRFLHRPPPLPSTMRDVRLCIQVGHWRRSLIFAIPSARARLARLSDRRSPVTGSSPQAATTPTTSDRVAGVWVAPSRASAVSLNLSERTAVLHVAGILDRAALQPCQAGMDAATESELPVVVNWTRWHRPRTRRCH